MKKWTIFFSISSLVLIIGSLVMLGITYGWFSSLFTIPDGQVGVGELKYVPEGSFVSNGTLLVPDDELVSSAFVMTNNSTIDSQLRIQIIYTKVTNVNDVITSTNEYYVNAPDDHISVIMDPLFVQSGDYFYYGGESYVIDSQSGIMNLVSSIIYDGEFTGIDYATMPINVTIRVEVKQAGNVTWNELLNYDFSTGYPA